MKVLIALVLSSLLSLTASAHHPVTAKFDTSDTSTLEGIVTKVDWRNPHVHIFVNVGDNNTDLENWAVEIESPITLMASGWQEDTLSPGDTVSVVGYLAKDGSRQIWGDSVKMNGSNSAIFTISDDGPTLPVSSRPAPVWSDGQIALGASDNSLDGYWGYPSEYILAEDGSEVEVSKYGLLASLEDADDIAPFQPWALEMFKERQRRGLQDDPMFLNCKPPGGPRQFQSDLGIKFVEDKKRDRVFVLYGSGNRNYRIIYGDGREQIGQVSGDDDNPLYYGRSVSHWEGDTYVVNVTSFNEDFWMSHGGLPHTNLLALEERFTRTSMDTMTYEVTINDPGAYTRPWTASWELTWVGGKELPVHFCQENRP